jgi:hypothetical protein
MYKLLALICLLWFGLGGGRAEALTVGEAQECAEQLLRAYDTRKYPSTIIDEASIIQRTVGRVYDSMRVQDQALINEVALQYLRDSFENPSGAYQYQDVKVEEVEPTDRGHRITGTVVIITSEKAVRHPFTTLTSGSGCVIYQVRVAEMTSIDARLRNILEGDKRTRRLVQ